MKNTLGIILIAATLWPLSSPADEKLNWSDVVRKVQENNEELKASEASLRASEFDLKGSYNNFFPQISAGANFTHGKGTTDLGSVESTNYSTSLTATQNLFSGLADDAKINQAQGGRDIARIALQITQASVSYNLKSAYSNLVYAQNAIKLTEDIQKRRESNLRLVELRFENGRENKGSVLLSKAYLEQARLDNLQARQALDVARAQVAKLLGRSEGDEFIAADSVPVKAPPQNVDFKMLSQEVPNYLQSIAQEEVADAGVTLARSSFFPTLNLTAQAGDSGDTWYPGNNRWSVGAGISIPLFNGGRDYYATKSSLESRRVALLNKDSSLRDGLVNVKQAYSTYILSVQRLNTDKAFVEAASVRSTIAKQQYNNGLLNFNDWDIIENDLIARQKALLLTERDRVTSEAAWEQVLGRGVFYAKE